MIVEIYECASVTRDGKTGWYLRLKDLAPATAKEDGKFYIDDRKYHGQIIEVLNQNYQNNLLVCKKTPYRFEREEWSKLDELLKNQLTQLEFQKIDTVNDQILLSPVFDEKLLPILRSHFNLDEQKENIINSIIAGFENGTGSFILGKEEKDLLLNRREKEKEKISIPKAFHFNIHEMYSNIERKVYGQKEQLKQVLATMIYNQDILSKYEEKDDVAEMKKIVLLCGTTGTGKTLMIKNIAKELKIPYIIEDTTRYTATGYEGENVDHLLTSLVSVSPDITSAQNGIIFLDEFDKICHTEGEKSNIRTKAVQEHLLKMIEGTTVRKKIKKGFLEEEFAFDTRGVTFVLSGAFQELTKEGSLDEKKLISYGMLPEISGRISDIIQLATPTRKDYHDYLTVFPNSYLEHTADYLKTLGVFLDYDESSIEYLVEEAMRFESGYRGVKKALDESVNPHLFDCYAGKTKKITLTRK